MKVVALIAQKGGVGKSTLAVNLAVQAERAGYSVAVIDTDTQSTASGWYLKRKGRGVETPFVGSVTQAAQLAQAVEDAREEGFDWLFIDTPPHVDELPAAAASVADLILMPCVPSANNMDAMAPSAELVKRSGKPGFFIINCGRSKAINDDCAVALSSNFGLPAVSVHIARRMPIADGEIDGTALPELTGRAASITKGQEELASLFSWIDQQQKGRAA